METQLPKHTYYKDSNFVLEIQFYEGQLLLHCEVLSWTLSSLRRGYSVFKTLQEEAKEFEIDRMVTITPNPKFAKLFGGTTISEIEYNDIKYEVIEWVLKQ